VTNANGYEIGSCNTPVQGALAATACTVKCAPGYLCTGSGCTANGDIKVTCPPRGTSATPGQFVGVGDESATCKAPFTPAPTYSFDTAFINFARFEMVARAEALSRLRETVFLTTLSAAFEDTSTPQVVGRIVSKDQFESDDTKMVRITVAMLPDMIDGGTQYIKDVQDNLEAIAKSGMLDQTMKSQGYVLRKVERICDSNICTKTVCEASEESCRGDKDLSLNKDYFYPGFTEFEA